MQPEPMIQVLDCDVVSEESGGTPATSPLPSPSRTRTSFSPRRKISSNRMALTATNIDISQDQIHQDHSPRTMIRVTSMTSDGSSQVKSERAPSFILTEDVQVFSPRSQEEELPMAFVVDRLGFLIEANTLYFQLVFYLLFLGIFATTMLRGKTIEQNHFVYRGFRSDFIAKIFSTNSNNVETFRQQVAQSLAINVAPDHWYKDIGNAGDWISWFSDSLLTSIYSSPTPFENDSAIRTASQFGMNVYLGGMRLRIFRVKNNSCSMNSDLMPTMDKKNGTIRIPGWFYNCYSPHEVESEETRSQCPTIAPYVSSQHRFGETTTALEGVYHTGGFTVLFPFNMTLVGAMKKWNQVLACGLIDNKATRFLTAEYFLYTPQTHTYHGIKLYTEVLPGGAWVPQYKFRSFEVHDYDEQGSIAIDLVFFAYVFYYVVIYLWDAIDAFQKKQFKKFLFDVWNGIELVNLAIFIAVIGIKVKWWILSSEATDSLVLPVRPEYLHVLDDIMIFHNAQSYANSINMILTFLKLLKFLRLNRRLSIITTTMAVCRESVFGIVVLFFIVLLGYGLTALTLFGENIESYRSLGVAVNTLMLIVLGVFDYRALVTENKFLAAFFFWTYVVIAVFLLLNFVIAVLTEAFSDVSGMAYGDSIDVVIMKTWEEIKRTFHPKTFHAVLRMYSKGKTPSSMVTSVRDQLKASDKITISRQGVKRIISATTHDDMGEWYLDFLWADVKDAHEQHEKEQFKSEKITLKDLVSEGTRRCISFENFEAVQRLGRAITALEEQTQRIQAAL